MRFLKHMKRWISQLDGQSTLPPCKQALKLNNLVFLVSPMLIPDEPAAFKVGNHCLVASSNFPEGGRNLSKLKSL